MIPCTCRSLFFTALVLLAGAAGISAQSALIGGDIFTGAKGPDGKPLTVGAEPILDAQVMVQNMHSGGAFVTYPSVYGNSWQAVVPPGEYVVMFSAPGHDCTSREFVVRPDETQTRDAYLPPLPAEKANLLVYCFLDNAVNGEDDFPDDPAMRGVTLHVWDEHGNLAATGVSGTNPGNLPPVMGVDPKGLYYFQGLEPGEYKVSADPSTAPSYGGGPSDWYGMTTEEGGAAWEVNLYPGDPGTEDGIYLLWFGFVPKLGQLPPGPNTGTISGTMLDADGNDPAEPFPYDQYDLVSPNITVPDGLVVLFTNSESGPIHPIATVEADPVTGAFHFDNVPAGAYKLHNTDLSLEYVWTENSVNVSPGQDVVVNPLVPRFFARAQGYVTDKVSMQPIAGADVRMRLKDGSVWKRTTTDANGWYNLNALEEVEVMGFVDVKLPEGYRPARRPGDAFGVNCRYIQWYTFNYRADLELTPIPAEVGDIGGCVFNDHLAKGTWLADGVYDEDEERTFGGVDVSLFDVDGNLVARRTTSQFEKSAVLAQGWQEPYTYPPDEFGNVFKGPLPGSYAFEGLPPGTYRLEVSPLDGFSPSPMGSGVRTVEVRGGLRTEVNFGVATRVPLAGEIEGGVFDDVNIDANRRSLLFLEKAGIPGIPVGVYDHFGYFLGSGTMGNPLCFAGSVTCPEGEEAQQKPEVERRLAPGIHIYLGNDPSLPGYNKSYLPMALPYTFGQGKYKFEADWSLLPVSFGGQMGAMVDGGNVVPQNRPVLSGLPRSMVAPNDAVRIDGAEFGDAQGYSTVTLAGERLTVLDWSDTSIEVRIPADAFSGALVVATSTGLSNALKLQVRPGRGAAAPAGSFVFVDSANTGAQDGSELHPWQSIAAALADLPLTEPRRVMVAPGTYRERIQISQSGVQLIGAGPLETILEGLPASIPMPGAGQGILGGGPVIRIGAGGETGSVHDVRISGFTITGGTVDDDLGGGIFADYGNVGVEINTCMIYGNGGTYGGGIWMHHSNHDVRIHSNIIAENGNAEGYGGGISVNDEPEYGPEHGEPEHIWDDRFPGPPPGLYEITNNLIFHNYSPDYGSGICLYEVKDHLAVYGNMILENKAEDHGGGAFFEDTGPVDLFGNVFLRNYCNDDGGAVAFEDVGDQISTIRIFNNLIAENIADDRGENGARGAGLSFDDTFHAQVFNNTIVGNVVAGSNTPAGGGIDCERNGHEYALGGTGYYAPPGFSDPKVFNNILWDNWRLEYDQGFIAGEEEDLDYTWGVNYRWYPDQMHVDNPALQEDWETHLNSESFSWVRDNDIRGGYGIGLGNLDVEPVFSDPTRLDWHLQAVSPLQDLAPAHGAPEFDLDMLPRTPTLGGVELGAYDVHAGVPQVVRIPRGILGKVLIP